MGFYAFVPVSLAFAVGGYESVGAFVSWSMMKSTRSIGKIGGTRGFLFP